MALWVLYSWCDATLSYGVWELKKIDKIELVKLLSEEQSCGECEVNDTVEPISQLENQNMITDERVVPIELNDTLERKSETNITIHDENISIDDHNSTVKKLPLHSDTKDRIFVFGDSMGEGIAIGLSRLKKEFNFTYRSIAKCSTTTQYWLNYPSLEKEIQGYKPTVVFIVLGTNEWNNVTSATMVRMIKLRKRLEPLGVEIRWITPPVATAQKFFEVTRDVFGEDVYDSRFVQIPRGEDHVHSTPHGYEMWSRHILSSLNVPRRLSL